MLPLRRSIRCSGHYLSGHVALILLACRTASDRAVVSENGISPWGTARMCYR